MLAAAGRRRRFRHLRHTHGQSWPTASERASARTRAPSFALSTLGHDLPLVFVILIDFESSPTLWRTRSLITRSSLPPRCCCCCCPSILIDTLPLCCSGRSWHKLIRRNWFRLSLSLVGATFASRSPSTRSRPLSVRSRSGHPAHALGMTRQFVPAYWQAISSNAWQVTFACPPPSCPDPTHSVPIQLTTHFVSLSLPLTLWRVSPSSGYL